MKSASRIKMAATVASVVRASTRPGAPSLPERVQAVPRLVRATRDGSYAGTTLKRLGLVAGAVVYVASPVDLLPEAVLPVIGAADDAVVISWAVKAFFEETERFIAWEAGQGLHPPRSRRGPAPWAPASGVPSDASRATVPGVPLGGEQDAQTRAWTGEFEDGLRRDRDTTGAAAPGRIAGRVTRVTGSFRRPGGARGGSGSTATGAGSASGPDGPGGPGGPGGDERVRLPEGTRQAATDYVLESVRKRLER
ncbi:YkvA family protein [Terrabacter sp. LjRoot27]|uniref:YkvA family protein n=1 Tax=Terrabacter sp. LjRoot27 TaxID=3342306 RepID=UPI003ECD5EF9